MKNDPEKEQLLAAIDHAFRGVRLEDGVSANMAEYNEAPWARKAHYYRDLARSDEREDWRKVDDTTLETRENVFHFSDPKGFRFYAPAFMQYAVRNHDTSLEFIVNGIIYALSPDNNVFEKVPFEECFTPEQIAVIQRFLEYCIAHDGTLDGRAAAENLQKIRQRIGGTCNR